MIGTMVSQYRILAEIGRGSMGIVFRAQDTARGRDVALKIIAEKLVDDPQMLRRFEQEGATASALHHPNIRSVYESGDWKGRPYLAMELLEGETLDQVLKAGPLPVEQVVEIGIEVASALEATHAIGVIHRDIKPGNLFLTTAGPVKVLDFGLAKVRLPQVPIGEESTTMAMYVTSRGVMVGTLAYMAPEQVRCELLDGRADLFSLGVTLYELATGELPALGSAKLPALRAGLDQVVARLTAFDVRARYQTAGEAIAALRNCAVGRERFERRAL